MPNVSSPAALPQYIEQLLNQRHQHTAAIAAIDATLEKVTAALGGSAPKPAMSTATPMAPKKRGRPFKNPLIAAKAPAPVKAASAPKTRRSRTGMTANEFVLAFVESKKNPTSQEINQHWKDSGRLGAADNSLSILTKAKKLKRIPLGEGIRGSRYSLA